jgi:predicted RecB family nuclease
VNVASHDDEDAPLRYACIEWNDGEPAIEHGEVRSGTSEILRVWGVKEHLGTLLAAQGYDTLPALAAASPAGICDALGWTPKALREAARIGAHAQALLEDRPVPIAPPESLPARIVYIDVETSDDKQDDPWLVGLALPSGEVVQFQQLDHERHAEQVARVEEVLSAYPDARLASWGAYDRTAMRRAMLRLGHTLPPWMKPGRWFDLMQWVRRNVALPLETMELKAIGGHLGFEWRSPDLDGRVVGAWYRSYRIRRKDFDVDAVRSYNEDDVRALLHVVGAVQQLLAPRV